MKKKLIAMLCVVAMLVNCISYIGSPMTASAEGTAEETGYRELTFSDWGMTNGEYVDMKEYSPIDASITGLDNVAFNGMIETTSSAAFYIGGKDSGWSGILVHVLANEEKIAISSATQGYTELGTATLTTDETIKPALEDDTFSLKDEFQLRLTFDVYENNNLYLGVYINDVQITTVDFNNGIAAALGTKLMVYLTGSDLDLRDVVNGEPAYQELTLKDFGIYPGTLTSEIIGTSDGITSLDEVAVSGKVKFGEIGWLLMGHESTELGEWSGIQMFANAEGGLNISSKLYTEELKQFEITGENVDYQKNNDGNIEINFAEMSPVNGFYDIDFQSVTYEKDIHIFMRNNSNHRTMVQLNWKGATTVLDENGNEVTTDIVDGSNQTYLPADSGWYEVIYTKPEGSDIYSVSQFNCHSESETEPGLLEIKGYYVDDGTSYIFPPSEGVITKEEVGADFVNDYVDMRFTFDYTTSGVDMGVTINDKFIKTIGFGVSEDGTRNIKELLGSCIMATGGFSTQGTYRELTFEDFNIPTGTLATGAIGTNDSITSLDGVAVSGAVKFGNGWLLMGHESVNWGEWSGIQMVPDAESGDLNVSGALWGEEPLSKLNITAGSGLTQEITEEGYVKVSFDGSQTSTDLNFASAISGTELHLFVKNVSTEKRAIYLDWDAATKILDENGEDVTDSIVSGYVFPANSGWYEVIYRCDATTEWKQLNCTSVGADNKPIDWEGSLLFKGYYVDTRQTIQYQFAPSSNQIGSEETGVDFVNDVVNMRYTFDYTDTGVAMGVYVNDNYIKTIDFADSTDGVYNIKDLLGPCIMVTDGFTHEKVYPEENAKKILEDAGYTRVTVPDFGGMGYQTYTKEDGQHGHRLGEYAWSDTLNKTYLDMNVTFENITSTDNAYIRYGSSDGWRGFNISYDGTYMHVGLESVTPMIQILPQNVGLTKFDNVNVKIALDCGEFTSTTTGDATYDTADYTVSMWVNNRKVVAAQVKEQQAYAGTTLAVYVGNTDGTITIDMDYSDVTRTAVSYDLADGNYLVSGNATVTKDGETVVLTDYALSAPGDYEIVTDVSENRIKYHQAVTLYKVGDVELNGTAGEDTDLTALQGLYTGTEFEAKSAAQKGADLDNDGMVDADDLRLMEQICNASDSTAELENILDMYHVAAKSYDFIGGDNVMPIVGYYGPYNNAGYDFLSDKYFQMVKDSGINLVNYSFNGAAGTSEFGSVIKTLKLAEKHKIGWFLNDSSLNANMTDEEFAQAIGRYGYYDSFFGIHIVDEPVYKESAAYKTESDKELSNYTGISAKLNSYNNLTGFINLAPESSTYNCTMKTGLEAWWGNIMGEDSIDVDYFDEYFARYINDSKPSVLSIDDYPFNDDPDEGVTNADGYFRSLSMIRGESLEHDIPFWWYVQSGGSFRDVNAEGYKYDANLVATEEETYWNVNTALAFGAKGIEWFTLLQDAKFHDESLDSQGTDTSGLIDADGEETKFYNWARDINTHIQNVDEVLMKAESKGVITTGGYAASQVKAGADKNKSNDSTFKYPVITTDTTERLTEVTSDDSEYGALIGCFDYRDMEAYYVVNYNVTEGTNQKVTLQLNGDYGYRVLQQGTVSESVYGNYCELTIPAGQAVLVVLDTMLDVDDVAFEINQGFSYTANTEVKGVTIGGASYEATFDTDGVFAQWGQYDVTYLLGSNTYKRKLILYLLGDATFNGVNDSADIVWIKKASKNLITLEDLSKMCGDVDANNSIDESDAKALRKIVVEN